VLDDEESQARFPARSAVGTGLVPLCLSSARPQTTGERAETNVVLSSTVFVLDVSGSMAETWAGGVKLDTAKRALGSVLQMIEHDSMAHRLQQETGLVSFTDNGRLEAGLTYGVSHVVAVLQTLSPKNMTNVGEGLAIGVEEVLKGHSSKRLLVLLSDGMTNVGMSQEEILSGPVRRATQHRVPIHVCGYGTRGILGNKGIDEGFLKRVASATNGTYHYASGGPELENIYLEIRHQSIGKMIASLSGSVRQGETVQRSLNVPVRTGEMHFTGNYPGSQLDFILVDPDGRAVERGYPNASIMPGRPTYIIVGNPLAGKWAVKIYGRDVPSGQEPFRVLCSVREKPPAPVQIYYTESPPTQAGSAVGPPPEPSRGPWGIVLLALGVLCLAGVVAAFLIARHAAATGGAPKAFLEVVSGPSKGGRIEIRKTAASIGRRPGSDLVLQDPTVSRAHALILRTAEGWEVRDAGSQSGTRVNGVRVATQRLNSGDIITLGESTLRFIVSAPNH